MKNTLIIFAAASFVLFSCKPFYTCGEPIPDKRIVASKRVKGIIGERDVLCMTLENREQIIGYLKEDLSSLRANLESLEIQYTDLTNTNLSQADQFSLALKQKSEELQEKEKLVVERESALAELNRIVARQDSITNLLNESLRNALLGFNSDELSVEIKNGKVYVSMSDKLLFKSGSAAIETKGKEAIKALANVLNKNLDIDILVEGHTDNVPIKTELYRDNWDLSVARATSIVRILTDDYKITPTRLTASGRGEFFPRANNATTDGRANNRRTEIILSPKLDEIMKLLNNK